MLIPFILFALLVVGVVSPILIYNKIVKRRNETDNAFGSVDALLKKRYDLLPNLVETVRQYMNHEANVLIEISRLRSRLSESITNDEKIDIHNDISRKLSEVFLSVENYPALKANHNFLALQASWNEIEEQISAARRYYNATITNYNNSIQTFPANVFINESRFPAKKVFEINEKERNNISARDLFKALIE